MFLKFSKLHEEAITPTRSNPSDAGMDFFFCPSPGSELHERNGIMLHRGQNAVLPTGIKVAVPHGYALIVKNRSGLASKGQLVVGACVIDSGYGSTPGKGEIFIDLHNIGIEPYVINVGDKIAQLLLIPVVPFQLIETDDEVLYNGVPFISQRGGAGFGSTDAPPPQKASQAPSEQPSDPSIDDAALAELLEKAKKLGRD
jgi:dUTP pyrophosphatase